MNHIEFRAWPKIARKKKGVLITEKMDGTNGCIVIQDGIVVAVQSRNRFITPENDNAGFAQWVDDNKDLLSTLGNGYHFGEWCGPGIQNNPHELEEKTFYLFNVLRGDDHPLCRKVDVMYKGKYDNDKVDECMWLLSVRKYKAEGIIVTDLDNHSMIKYTFRDPKWKWL